MTNAEDAPIGNLPTREAIEAQLARILNSETLATSDRSKAFVAFVVRQSLLGKGAELQELVIGPALFAPSGFDPKTTSSARSASTRLLPKLAASYAARECHHNFSLTLPSATYTPQSSLT